MHMCTWSYMNRCLKLCDRPGDGEQHNFANACYCKEFSFPEFIWCFPCRLAVIDKRQNSRAKSRINKMYPRNTFVPSCVSSVRQYDEHIHAVLRLRLVFSNNAPWIFKKKNRIGDKIESSQPRSLSPSSPRVYILLFAVSVASVSRQCALWHG